MNRNSVFLLILILITGAFSGCSSMSNGEISRLTRDIKESPNSTELKQMRLTGTYAEVFSATVSVLHDLSISIPKKDYPEKEILAIAYIAKAFAPSAGSERYLINFEPQSGSVIVNIRTVPIKYTYDADFIFERIQKELQLPKEVR